MIFKFFDNRLECRIVLAFIGDTPKLSIQYTDEIIDEKEVLSTQDFCNRTLVVM